MEGLLADLQLILRLSRKLVNKFIIISGKPVMVSHLWLVAQT